MKRVFFILGLLLCCIQVSFSQQKQVWTENFDANSISFTFSPSNSWATNNVYATSPPNSYRGYVPNSPGEFSVLLSPVYDLTAYANAPVLLRFKHICKISPLDIARIEYKYDDLSSQWTTIPAVNYIGAAPYMLGFSSASYSQWLSNDSLAFPSLGWWKEEVFDLSGLAGGFKIQFRFILQHGTEIGTQISYGWLIDDFELIADNQDISLPTVELIEPFVRDTVYSTGPFEITARIKSNSQADLKTPIFLKYTTTRNGLSTIDSIEMNTSRAGIWKATIPSLLLNTRVDYQITATDLSGNTTTTVSGYVISQNKSYNYNDNSAALLSIDSPTQSTVQAGGNADVKVTIQNRGNLDLDSVYIHWSVNGVERTPYKWEGKLPWDYSDRQIQIGSYVASNNAYDTLVVWIVEPNGITDPVTNDDKITKIFYGCQTGLSKDYLIGNGGAFSTLSDAINVLRLCGASGNVTFKLQDDTYPENIDLTGLEDILTDTNSLHITSLSGIRENVIIKPSSDVAMSIGELSNLTIDNITVDATDGTYAVQFLAACTNVVVNNCILKALAGSASTTTARSVIYKNTNTGVMENIHITNNTLDGGYHGILLNAGTLYAFGDNILIENNIVTNQYYWGINLSYANAVKISNNTVEARTVGAGTTWRGIQATYMTGSITGNKIKQLNTAITTPSGLYLSSLSNYISDPTLVANNEIIITSGSTSGGGIYLGSSTNAIIAHNSVYAKSSGTVANRGIYITDGTDVNLVVKNNNFITTNSASYPIYLSAVTNLSQNDINYNNYHAPTNIGYATSARTTLEAWEGAVASDSNSVKVKPIFKDSSLSLELKDYTGLKICPVIHGVNMDINGRLRIGKTTIGCYDTILYANNPALSEVVNAIGNTTTGIVDTIKVVLYNNGKLPLTDVAINWKHNNTDRTPISWQGTLNSGNSVIVTLGAITYQSGDNIITACINTSNDYLLDDTVSMNFIACDSLMKGLYIIGTQSGSHFTTISQAVDKLTYCGINGAVTLALQDTVFAETVNFAKIPGSSPVNTITLTSLSGNKNLAVIQPKSGFGIFISDIENLIIDNITIDAAAYGTSTIRMEGGENITITNCNILARNVASPASVQTGIYKSINTRISNNIRIVNNYIEGGYYGIFLQAGSPEQYGKNIVIDSNVAVDQSYASYYIRYADLSSMSFNQSYSKRTNYTGTWTGIYLEFVKGLINGNKIHQRAATVAMPHGLALYECNMEDTVIVSNNEIIFKTTSSGSTSSYGAISTNAKINAIIVHNSIYMKGTAGVLGINIGNHANILTIQNNNIFMEAAASIPIRLNSLNYLDQWDINYNNYYAPTNIGYAGSLQTSLSAWQNQVPNDMFSVKVQPDFINIKENLDIVGVLDMKCPVLTNVPDDINGQPRTSSWTMMGAYHFEPQNMDATIYAITSPPELVTVNIREPVSITIHNNGLDTLKSVSIGWSHNGTYQNTYQWNGVLLPNQVSSLITIDSLLPVGGENLVTIWTSMPNGQIDEYVGNDTMQTSALTCDGPLSNGIYTVGIGGDFSSSETVLKALDLCGIDRATTFSFLPGNYGTLQIKPIQGSSETNTVTFESYNDDASSVFISGVVLTNAENITIKKVSIDYLDKAAVLFVGTAYNVEINACSVFADIDATAEADEGAFGIYRAASDNTVDDIRFKNNYISGGYAGIHFRGGTATSYGTNMLCDSNTVIDQYRYAIYVYHTDFKSISYNTILSKSRNVGTYWGGIEFIQSNAAKVNSNRIRQLSNDITAPKGINYGNFNYNFTSTIGTVANNEIIITYAADYTNCGIQISMTSKSLVYHNSIYVGGKGSAFYIANYANIIAEVKYNNIVVTDDSYIAYYTGGANAVPVVKIDSNNYHTEKYFGQVGSETPITTMPAWKARIPSDQHSKTEVPDFVDMAVNMELNDYTPFLVPAIPVIREDINGNVRAGITAIGCYTPDLLNVEALLTDMVNWQEAQTTGNKDTVKVILKNGGVTTITEANIAWSFNTANRTTVNWQGTLLSGQSVIIALGEIQYVSEENNVKIWIESIKNNNLLLTDDYPLDDTISAFTYSCDSLFNGTYTIGASGNFGSIKEAVSKMYNCGIKGPVIFELKDGDYIETVTLSGDIPGSSTVNTVTFTSVSKNKASVKVQREGGRTVDEAAFILDGVSNIVISHLSLDGRSIVTTGTYSYAKALILQGACDNIEVRDCQLTIPIDFSSGQTSDNMSVIYNKSTADAIISNVRIINNIIEGGAYGFFIDAVTGNRNDNILIQDNEVRHIDRYGIYVRYATIINIHNNSITQRSHSYTTECYGMHLSYTSANVTKNKISLHRVLHGIYLSYVNQSSSNYALIANNEVVANVYGTTARTGISVQSNSNVDVYHNTVLLTGTLGYAFQIATGATIRTNVQNNNFIVRLTSLGSYPIHIANATNIANYSINYNNYYNVRDTVGYITSMRKTMADWISAVAYDTNSVQVNPVFDNESMNLALATHEGLTCPLLTVVPDDIRDTVRTIVTTMGAYHFTPVFGEIAPSEIVSPLSSALLSETVPISVTIQNLGSDVITSAVLSYELNGTFIKSVQWTGNLAAGAISDPIYLDDFNGLSKNNELVIWTSQPNGNQDSKTSNDTIRKTIFGCDSVLNGTYTIGASLSTDFNTITDAVTNLYACGISSPVIFELEDGDYTETVTLSGTIPGSSKTNTVTFTSASGDFVTTSVQRAGSPAENDAPFILSNVSHVNITNLHLIGNSSISGNYTYSKAVILQGACDNIEISNCKLTLPNFSSAATSVNHSGIYSSSSGSEIISNIRILNNSIEGGAYGIYIYGASANHHQTITIQENDIKTDKYGIYTYWSDSVYILNNKITQRTMSAPSDFCGIYYRSVTGEVHNNSIIADSLNMGIYLQFVNDGVSYPAFITNNEIIAKKIKNSSYGIFAEYARINILHNSLLIAQGEGTGIELQATGTVYPVTAKNNIFVTMDSMSYPITLEVSQATTMGGSWTIDYNNYYAPKYIGRTIVGYTGSQVTTQMTTLPAWYAVVTGDVHSVRQQPSYLDSTVNLELTDTTSLTCPLIVGIERDIAGYLRIGKTIMGAWGIPPFASDIYLKRISNVPDFVVVGQSVTPGIYVENVGTNDIVSLEINWKHNGVDQIPVTWGGTLKTGEEIPISLRPFSAASDTNRISVYISSVNGSGSDMNLLNDTSRVFFYVCDSLLKGAYTIGAANANFTTIGDALKKLKQCGIGGDVIFALQNDTFRENIDLTSLASFMGMHALTLTSLTGNPNDAVIQPLSDVGITLGNTNNITLEAITIDAATSAISAIQFTDACSNIVINNCVILADSISTIATYHAIYKANGTGLVDNIRITNNRIDGGYYGIRFYGGTSASALGTNVRIDSNVITNSYNKGWEVYYIDFVSVFNNNISNRQNSSAAWDGMYFSNCNGDVLSNKIIQKGSSANVRGMYLSNHNINNSTRNAIIANNEIIVDINNLYSTLYADKSNISILHNSILARGTSARGIYVTGDATHSFIIKNNNIITQGASSYPIYLNSTYQSAWNIDYNNYYAPTNIGYAGSAHTLLSAFQAIVTSDNNSVKVQPNFMNNSSVSLELSDYTGLECPRINSVPNNINGEARAGYTTMGAYGIGIADKYDLALVAITEPNNISSGCAPDYVPVKYEIRNVGTIDHDLSVDVIKLHLSVTNQMDIPPFDTVITINNGVLGAFQTTVFELVDILNVSAAGSYYLSGWIENSRDTVLFNDTILNYVYHNTKIALPFDDDFSTSALLNLTVEALRGDSLWHVEQSWGVDSIIAPYYGTGKLVFRGGRGAMTQISTGQLELNRTLQPVLEFWYAHDNNKTNDSERDYTDIILSYDGGQTDSLLLRIHRYNPAYTTPGWERYLIDLSPFQDSSCVVISFVAFSFGGVQQIDRIAISSNQDLSVSQIIIPEYDICALKNKEIKIVVTNETNQNIDFNMDENKTDLCVMIFQNGSMIDSTVYPLEDILKGLELDTITVSPEIDFQKGQNIIRAYLTKSIDNNPINDIFIDTVTITPKFEIAIQTISTDTENGRASIGFENYQEVIIKNIGNMDLPDIEFVLSVNLPGVAPHFTAKTTSGRNLSLGDTMHITFDTAYTVPQSSTYEVTVYGYLVCDPSMVDTTDSELEYVNTEDLALVKIVKPEDDQAIDVVGSLIEVSIEIENLNSGQSYGPGDVKVGIMIINLEGRVESTYPSEEIDKSIVAGVPIPYTFKTKYTVPKLEEYYLVVYIEKEDEYNQNDTLKMRRKTDYEDVSISDVNKVSFSMEQNIPNPAKGNTIINYNIPQDGEIVFQLHNVNGQLLYSQKETVYSGDHQIDLDISNYASGIYFYTMEYKGQRIVKRMGIKR